MLRCRISTTFQGTKYFYSLYPSSCFNMSQSCRNMENKMGLSSRDRSRRCILEKLSSTSRAARSRLWTTLLHFFDGMLYLSSSFSFLLFLFFSAVCCTRYRFETILSVSDPITSYKLNNNEILGTGGSVGNKSGQRALWREKRWECQPEFKRRVPPYRESARLELSK